MHDCFRADDHSRVDMCMLQIFIIILIIIIIIIRYVQASQYNKLQIH